MAWMIFMCENVPPGTFDKANLQGLHVAPRVGVPTLPYNLHTNFVVIADFEPSMIGAPVKIAISFTDNTGKTLHSAEVDEAIPAAVRNDTQRIFMVIPVSWMVEDYGYLVLRVTVGNAITYSERWAVMHNDGPLHKANDPQIHSGMLGTTSGVSVNVPRFLARASASLTIIDQYLSPAALSALVTHVNPNVQIRVLTREKEKPLYDDEIGALRANRPTLEVGFSKAFHDRFVILNDNEVYVFGFSLKDLNMRRVSYFTKLFSLEESNAALEAFKAEWASCPKV